MRDRKRVKKEIKRLMRENEISLDELRESSRGQRRPRKSGIRERRPEKEEENAGSVNPIGQKIRDFQSWLWKMQNTPSVTRGSSRPVSSVFDDIFGRR